MGTGTFKLSDIEQPKGSGRYRATDVNYIPFGDDPARELEEEAKRFGLTLSSGRRTPAENKAAGGAEQSRHLTDEARDFTGDPEKMRQFYRRQLSTRGPNLAELYYDPEGGVKGGREIGAIGGHDDHVHVAFRRPTLSTRSAQATGRFSLTDIDEPTPVITTPAAPAPPAGSTSTPQAPTGKALAQNLIEELRTNEHVPAASIGELRRSEDSLGPRPVISSASPTQSTRRLAPRPQAPRLNPGSPDSAITWNTARSLEAAFESAKSEGDLDRARRYANELAEFGYEVGNSDGWPYVKRPAAMPQQISQGSQSFASSERALARQNRAKESLAERRSEARARGDQGPIAAGVKAGLDLVSPGAGSLVDAVPEDMTDVATSIAGGVGGAISGVGSIAPYGAPGMQPLAGVLLGQPLRKAGSEFSQQMGEQSGVYGGEGLKSDIEKGIAGSLPMVGAGLVAGALGGAALATGIVGAMGAAQTTGDLYNEALAAGLTDQDAAQVSLLGIPIGLTEMWGIGSLPSKALRGHAIRSFVEDVLLKTVPREMLEEGVQNPTQRVLQNLVAKGFYDPEREVFQAAGYDAIIGAITGGVMGGAMGTAQFASQQPLSPTPESVESAAPPIVHTPLNQPVHPETVRAEVEAAVSGATGQIPQIAENAIGPEGSLETVDTERAGKPPPVPSTPGATPVPSGALIPETVQRIEEPGVALGSPDKPHGLYTSPADVVSPHAELGGSRHLLRTNPEALTLQVDASEFVRTNRGLAGQSAGIAALRHLEPHEAQQLLGSGARKKELAAYLSERHPDVDWNRYYDAHEMLEGYGAIKAREAGYDAIYATDKGAPEFNEYVGLNSKAFLPESTSAAGGTGAAAQVAPPAGALSGTTVPERPETIRAQLQALREGAGSRKAVLVTPGEEMPESRGSLESSGLAVTKVEGVGTFIHDSRNVPRKVVRQMAKDGTYQELLGIVEPKSETTTDTVVARDPVTGTELQAAVVAPENVAIQADQLQEQFPEASVGVEPAQDVIDGRADIAEEVAPIKHKFSSSQVELPPKLAGAVKTLAQSIPDRDLAADGREDQPHITVKYGLHTEAADDLRTLLAEEGTIKVKLGKLSVFEGVEDGTADAVIAEVDSPDLHRLNQKIADALPHTDTHPSYKPHVTVAYVKPGLGKKYVGRADLKDRVATIDRVTFSSKTGEMVEIPLSGTRETAPPPKAVSKKTALPPRYRARVTGEESLAEFVWKVGGIQDSDLMGELKWLREAGGSFRKPGWISKTGKTVDYMREAADEAGYGPYESLNDFLDDLEKEARGDMVYASSKDWDAQIEAELAQWAGAPVESAVGFFDALADRRFADAYDRLFDPSRTDADINAFEREARRVGLPEFEIEQSLYDSRQRIAAQTVSETVAPEQSPPSPPEQAEVVAPLSTDQVDRVAKKLDALREQADREGRSLEDVAEDYFSQGGLFGAELSIEQQDLLRQLVEKQPRAARSGRQEDLFTEGTSPTIESRRAQQRAEDARAVEARTYIHKRFGAVTEAQDQTGVPKGHKRVIEDATGAEHIVQPEHDNQWMISPKSAARGSGLGLGSLAATARKVLGMAPLAPPATPVEDFKVSLRAKQILTDLGVPAAEKGLPNRLAGIYKLRSKNVRVQSLFDVFTVAHEGTHFLSDTYGIASKVINTTTPGAPMRKQLTSIYEDYYPGGSRSHSLRKRMEEGLAVLIEEYLYDPATINWRYPQLVRDFIQPAGTYYHPGITDLIDKMNDLIGDYARMQPDQRIAARIVSGEEVVKKDKGFNIAQRIVFEVFNRYEPLKRVGKQAGVSGTLSDPFVHAFNQMNRGSLLYSWVKGDNLLVLKKDGNWSRTPGSVKTYLELVKGKEKDFDTLLVARRVVEDHNRLAHLLSQINSLPHGHALIAPLQEEADSIAEILRKDAFVLQDATATVNKFEPQFREALLVYDNINKRLVDFAENSGLITREYGDNLRASQGYASFIRNVNDELRDSSSSIYGGSSAQTKARSFKQRTGGTLDIVSPTFNQITAIHEIISKSLDNVMWRKVYDLSLKNSEIARRFEQVETTPAVDDKGRISYPQDRDPSLLKVFVDGQRVYIKAAPEFLSMIQVLRAPERDLLARLITIPSNIFTRLTTSANPLFAAGNLTVDQVSAFMQTKTGLRPVFDPIAGLVEGVKELAGRVPFSQQEFKKYLELGGKRQTFAAQHEVAPEETIAKLTGGNTRLQKAGHWLDLGLGVLELPSNLSEYATRFAEFRRAKQLGLSDTEAMYRASEVTVPFQLRGRWGGRFGDTWVRTLPYFNAAVQVNYKFARTAAEDPQKVATLGAGIIATALATAIAAMKWMDEEDKRFIANMPARELARAIFIPNPFGVRGSEKSDGSTGLFGGSKEGRGFIRIRVPEQFGALSGLVYLYVFRHYGQNKVRFNEILDSLSAPLPEAIDITSPKKIPFGLTPAALRPTLQTITNTRTYPELAPIVPDSLKGEPPELQYTAYTSDIAKKIGMVLKVPPAKIDFWVKSQFGAVGGMLLGKMPQFPLYRQEGEYWMSGRAYTNFYDQKQLAEEQFKRVKRGVGNLSPEESREIVASSVLYDKVADILSNLKRASDQQKNVPEGLKANANKLLLEIDEDTSIERLGPRIDALNRQVLEFASRLDKQPKNLTDVSVAGIKHASRVREWEAGLGVPAEWKSADDELRRLELSPPFAGPKIKVGDRKVATPDEFEPTLVTTFYGELEDMISKPVYRRMDDAERKLAIEDFKRAWAGNQRRRLRGQIILESGATGRAAAEARRDVLRSDFEEKQLQNTETTLTRQQQRRRLSGLRQGALPQ